MNDIIKQIHGLIKAASKKKGFLDLLFGEHKEEALNGTPVVLFGASSLGQELCFALKNHGISPLCFCDNDGSKSGASICGIPIISFDELKRSHRESLIVIATSKYLDAVAKQLLENGFPEDRVLCKRLDLDTRIAFMFSMLVTQFFLAGLKKQYGPRQLIDVLTRNENKLAEAYNLFADHKSKKLFIAKLALMASNGSWELFKEFMLSFSEPILECGLAGRSNSQIYYYFNNDVLTLSEDEVYVDVGAFNGDTVQTFVDACTKRSVNYKRIYAFEPDPQCYQALAKSTNGYQRISCHQLGLWSQSKVLRFTSSDNAIISEAGAISNAGNIEIQVVSLDDFLHGEEVTFIKMDPGGNIITEVVKGAADTIAKYKPKLALGAYHSIESIFEIPLLVNSICPEYKLYLRHNTCHLCDTDLYAVA